MRWMMVIIPTLISNTVFADSLVSCVSHEKKPVKVVEYLVRPTKSSRLNSGIIYTKANQTVSFDQDRVAQYKTTNGELFLIVDNMSDNIIFKMSAHRYKNYYMGRVVEKDETTEKTIRKVQVVCTVKSI